MKLAKPRLSARIQSLLSPVRAQLAELALTRGRKHCGGVLTDRAVFQRFRAQARIVFAFKSLDGLSKVNGVCTSQTLLSRWRWKPTLLLEWGQVRIGLLDSLGAATVQLLSR
jgi:hypothetical protein